MILNDLLVWLNPVMTDVTTDRFIAKTRPATLADLIEVLQAGPDTLVISKVDGEWPLGLVELAAITLCDMDDDPKWSELDSVYSESMADQVREICRANTKAALDALLEGQPK